MYQIYRTSKNSEHFKLSSFDLYVDYRISNFVISVMFISISILQSEKLVSNFCVLNLSFRLYNNTYLLPTTYHLQTYFLAYKY